MHYDVFTWMPIQNNKGAFTWEDFGYIVTHCSGAGNKHIWPLPAQIRMWLRASTRPLWVIACYLRWVMLLSCPWKYNWLNCINAGLRSRGGSNRDRDLLTINCAALSCTTYSSMLAGAALSVSQRLLSHYLKTNTESLTDTERTINNSFIILFEKTIVKYTDTESSSLLPVVLCDLRQLRRFKYVLLPSSVHYYPSK